MKQLMHIFIGVFVLLGCQKEEFLKADTIGLGHAGEGIRNGRNKFPPNTIESINHVFESTTIDGVEVDVQMTKDSQLVAFHDFELDINTNGVGCIPELDYSELESIKVYNSSIGIYLLTDVLTAVMSKDKDLYLDIKYTNTCTGKNIDFNTFNGALAQNLASFSHEEKQRIVVNATSLSLITTISDTSLIKSVETDNFVGIIDVMNSNEIDVLTTKLKSINDQQINTLHQANKKVCLYQLYTSAENKEAIINGADYIISDKVGCAAQLLNGKE